MGIVQPQFIGAKHGLTPMLSIPYSHPIELWEERVDAEKLLEFRAVSKEFGGTKALTAVSLDLKRGEILALLGEERRLVGRLEIAVHREMRVQALLVPFGIRAYLQYLDPAHGLSSRRCLVIDNIASRWELSSLNLSAQSMA